MINTNIEEAKLSLRTAHVTQGNAIGDLWFIKNEELENIGDFPSTWSTRDCIAALTVGRKFEIKAYEQGLEDGMERNKKVFEPLLIDYYAQVKALEEMNEKLSSKLEQLIIQGE